MDTALITGTSSGVGKAAARKFLDQGISVVGLDIKAPTIYHSNFYHYTVDVREKEKFPNLYRVDYIINNAGIVTPQADAMDVNFFGYVNILEKYGQNEFLKSIVQIGSTASFKGYDNIRYCGSQGARDALTKWAANNFGSDSRHVLVNSLNLDGIVPADENHEGTSLEPELYQVDGLMDRIKDLSVLKKLSTVEEIADWIYFLAVVNKVMTGEILHIDGELIGAYEFIKYPGWDS